MSDRRLANAFTGLAEALLPDSVLSQERSLRGMVNDDATLRSDALAAALPWSVRDVFLPGDVPTGTNIVRLAMPQGARIRHVALAAGTPPTGEAMVIQIGGGAQGESFSIPAGQSFNAGAASTSIAPGGAASVHVLAAGGAQNVTVSIHYSTGGS